MTSGDRIAGPGPRPLRPGSGALAARELFASTLVSDLSVLRIHQSLHGLLLQSPAPAFGPSSARRQRWRFGGWVRCRVLAMYCRCLALGTPNVALGTALPILRLRTSQAPQGAPTVLSYPSSVDGRVAEEEISRIGLRRW